MSAIFISHSSKNNDAAREMKEHLAAQGHVGVFLDFDPADGIPAGRDWEQELYQQIRSSRAVIVLCSKPLMESRWCFAEITHARALGKHLFPVKIEECNLDAVLTDRQVVDLTTEKEAGYQRLWTGLKAAGLDPADAFDWDPTREPYPGLVTFEERDAAVYFGRDDEIHDGLDRLNRVRRLQVSGFAMVTGASGCGKSSLVRAGLVPRLRQDPQRWIVTDPFRPRQDVVRELSFSLSAAFQAAGKPVDPQVIRDRLSAALVTGAPQSNPLRDMAHELRSLADQSEAKVLMIVDQFEELFGKDAQPSDAFLRLLRDAANGVDSPLIVLGTIRSDLIAEFRSSEPLRGLEFEVLAIGPMSPQGLRDVILGPAELAGVTFEEGLIDEMAHDASLGDALPLLAFALRELHDRFGADREFAREEYRDGLGGLEGALRTRAEETLAAEALDPRLESQLRLAMLQMVRLDTTGRRSRQIARWADLPADAHPVLERLVAARLLVSGDTMTGPAGAPGQAADGDGGRTLEVAHEALFRSWDRLGRWISESAEELLLRTDLRDAAAGWKSRRQPTDELWVGTRLAQARDRLQPASALDDESREFLDAALEAERSRNEAARVAEQRLRDAADRRRRRLLVGVSGVAAVFALLSVVATGFFIQSRRNAHEARLATQAAEKNARDAETARAGEARSARDARKARDVAVHEKARAVESLFQGLGLNVGKDQYPGSICTEPDAGCTFGSEISGIGSQPSDAAAVTVLGALDDANVELIGPPGARPDSRDFVVASEWGEGRVIGYAHDGLISDTAFRNCPKDEQGSISASCAQGVTQADRADNLTFVDNALRWVHDTASCNSGPVQVAIFEGFQTRQNTSEIADLLTTRDWSYQPLDPDQPLGPQLECASALVWGNPWDGVSDEQLRDVVEYVRNGGGLLLGGLGWSWRDFSGSAMADYPSSRLAAVFGFGFTTDAFQPAATVRVLPATGS